MVANLKPRVADVVNDHVPSFLNTEAPNFVKFLEQYYSWLEDDGNTLNFLRNIVEQHDHDLADDVYKRLIENGILNNIPPSIKVDKSILVKHIKDIFKSKGTEDSFQFLLNAVFGEEASLYYGRDYYSKSSDTSYTKDTIIVLKQPKVEAVARLFRGQVVAIDVIESDLGINTIPTVTLTRHSNDSSVSNLPEIEFNLSGHLTSATVESGGYGYTTATVTVVGECTTPAQITAIVADGTITNLILNQSQPGVGYKEKPTIVIEGDGFGATGTVEWTATLGNVNIIDGKSGWTVPPKIEFIGGTGTKTLYDSNNQPIQTVTNTTAKVDFDIDSNGTVVTARIVSVGEGYQFKPSIRWHVEPNEDAVVEPIISNNKIVGFKIIEEGTNYSAPPIVSFDIPIYDYTDLVGQKVYQEGENYASAIVDDVYSTVINGQEYFIVKLMREGLHGKFNSGTVIENEAETIVGISVPIFSAIETVFSGSGYKMGQRLNFVSEENNYSGHVTINDVSRGGVDEILVTKTGHGYKVGDEIVTVGTEIDDTFSAKVTAIDGIGADVAAVMEIDEIKIIDNGYNYQVGDILYLYGGNNQIVPVTNTTSIPNQILPFSQSADYKLAELVVASTMTSNDLSGIKIMNGGTGYQYVSLAILPDPTSTVPLRQIRSDKTSYYYNGSSIVKESSKGTLSYQTISGVIRSINWSLTNPDLNDSSVSIIVNGAGASMSVNAVDGNGAITDLTITTRGINYVRPRTHIVTSTGSYANISVAINEYGSIIADNTITSASWSSTNGGTITVQSTNSHQFTSGSWITIKNVVPSGYNGTYQITKVDDTTFTYLKTTNPGVTTNLSSAVIKSWAILNGGKNYIVSDSVAINEEYGRGAVLTPIFKQGGVVGFQMNSRGEFKEINKYGLNKYTLFGGHGAGLELDIYYRVKRVDIKNQGKNYSNYTLTVGPGHGYGAVLEPVIQNDVITQLSISNGGSNYTWAKVYVSSGTGTGFVGTAVINAGVITAISINNGGYGYDVADDVTVLGDGSGAVVGITTTRDGVVSEVKVISGGQNYHTDCFVTLTSSTTPSISALLSPNILNGVLKSVTVVNSGAGYAATTTASFDYQETSNDPDPSQMMHSIGTESFTRSGTFSRSGTTCTITMYGHQLITGETVNLTFSSGITAGNFVVTKINDSSFSVTTTSGSGTGTVTMIRDVTYRYGTTGTTTPVGLTSCIWPLTGTGLINSIYTVVDFVDVWPQTIAFDKDAQYKIISEVYGSIQNSKIVSGGTGYYSSFEREPLSLSVNGDGSGAVANANIVSGQISTITVTDGGQHYYSEPTIKIVGDGEGATAIANITGYVKTIGIIDEGVGYMSVPTIDIQAPETGTQATASPVTTLVHDYLDAIEITNGGSGYTIDKIPAVSVTGGGGSGVIATAVVDSGKVINIIITNPGNNFTSHPTVTIGVSWAQSVSISAGTQRINAGKLYQATTTGTTGATAPTHTTGTVSDGAVSWLYVGVAATAESRISCRITGVTVTNGGSEYDFIPSVSVHSTSGSKTVLSAYVDSKVDSIAVTNSGTGYTTATVVIDNEGSGGSDAVLQPILKNGQFVDVLILDGGHDYKTASISIFGGQLTGTPAELTPVIQNGIITDIVINNPGTGYYYGTSAVVLGNGENAKVAVDVDTGITRVELVEGGNNYWEDTSIGLTVVDNNPVGTIAGSGAVLVPVISNGKVVDITIQNPGVGYHDPQIIVNNISGGGCSANAYADRPISTIRVLEVGKNYTNASILIIGDGSGAQIEPIISLSSLKSINVDYPGNRYSTVPTLTITDESNYGAITNVAILDKGGSFHQFPVLNVASETGENGEVVSFSKSIGKVKNLRFDNFSIGYDDVPIVQFPIVATVTENAFFIENELVYIKGHTYPNNDYTKGPHAYIKGQDFERNLIYLEQATDQYSFKTESGMNIIMENSSETLNSNYTLSHEISNGINANHVLMGSVSKNSAKILRLNRAHGYGKLEGIGEYPLKLDKTQSAINDRMYRLHNNKKYQDYSYIVKTGLNVSDYKAYVDSLLHIAGYLMFGDVVTNTKLKVPHSLPIDEQTGKQLYDIITLIFNLTAGQRVSYYHDFWRIENWRSNEHETDTVTSVEATLNAGIVTNTTWLTEVHNKLDVGSGTYTLTDNLITVTKTGHGLVVGDKIYLNFNTGGGRDGLYRVASLISSPEGFTVAAYDPTLTGNVSSTKNGVTKSGLYTFTQMPLIDCTINLNGHGYLVGDVVWLEFTGDVKNAGYYTIKTKTTDSFTVAYAIAPAMYTASYSGTGTTTVTVTLNTQNGTSAADGTVLNESHHFAVGDHIHVMKELPTSNGIPTGSVVDGDYTITAVNEGNSTFTFTNSVSVNTTSGGPYYIKVLPTLTSGNVSIMKYVKSSVGNTDIVTWKLGDYYNMNTIIEYIDNKYYFATNGHIADANNSPTGISSLWQSYSVIDKYTYY